MAFMSQERKKELSPWIKQVLAKYDLKASITVNNHSTLVVSILEWPIDFFSQDSYKHSDKYDGTHMNVNVFWISDNFAWIARDALMELYAAMQVGNYDHSDSQSDYFCVWWHSDIQIGKWDKPYVLI
jgi:hypothetical protein